MKIGPFLQLGVALLAANVLALDIKHGKSGNSVHPGSW